LPVSAEVNGRRRYDAQGRRRRAEEKRTQMLDAARELFLAGGYHATTMEAIADRVGVSVESIYAAFGNKMRLFARAVDVAIVGDQLAIPLLQRDWVGEVRAEPSARTRLWMLTGVTTSVLSRVGPLHAIVRSLVDTDAELGAYKRRQDELRYKFQLEFVRLLEDSLRPGLNLEAARDIYWTVASPEVHHLLTVDRGWPNERYRDWLMSVLEPALLAQRGL
jgi:AcrR family transcriptional regulator